MLSEDHYKQSLQSAPLAVFDGETQAYRSIPASFQALSPSRQQWNDLSAAIPPLLSALDKAVAYVRRDRNLFDFIYGHLQGLEWTAASGAIAVHTADLASIRCDFFFDHQDRLKILEVNTTIPAMQAYSDMILEAYRHARGEPLQPEKSNTKHLLDSLLRHYHHRYGKRQAPRIAIIARKNDSQLAELRWFQKKWQQILGHDEVYLGCPDQVGLGDSGLKFKENLPIDIVYRHIFASRLESPCLLWKAMHKPGDFCVLNPVAAHFEVKALLAIISSGVDASESYLDLGLSEAERHAIKTFVPWTRLVQQSTLKDIAKHPQGQLVVKSSAGYGGHLVFMGDAFDTPDVQSQVRSLCKSDTPVTWQSFLEWCTTQRAWVVQQRVDGKQVTHRFLDRYHEIQEACSYVDCSGFWFPGSSGLGTNSDRGMGGAARFAQGAIVNIGRGGGLMPFMQLP